MKKTKVDLVGLKGDPRYFRLLEEMADLHARKSADYGSADGEKPLDNVVASAELGIEPWLGVLLRMNDKWVRLKNFAKKRRLACESARDSLMDLAAYALITIILMEEENANG
jgi:hypothetical protein